MNAPSLPAPPDRAVPAVRLLKRGERVLEPDVYVARLGDRDVVVKDYRRYRWTPLSPLARWMVRHEAGILARLHGWGVAPALLGTMGGLVLGMEYVSGEVLGAGAHAVSDAFFRRLRGAVAALHAAGITHNDLHGANVLVREGMPVLIDFASALSLPAWMARGPLGRQLRRGDVKNVLKLESRVTGQPPSPREAVVLAEPPWVRTLRSGWKRVYRRLRAG